MIQISFDWLKAALQNFWHVFTGLATTAIGYFLPVKDIVHIILFFFALDIVFGIAATKKIKKKRLSVEILWSYTLPRVLISLVLIIASYMWDRTFGQEWVSTYKLIGWFICGILLYSVAENGYKITRWRIFSVMGKVLEHKIEEASGMDIKDIPSDNSDTHGK